MRTLRTLITILPLLLICATPARAGTPDFGATIAYNPVDKSTTPVITTKIGTQHDLFGHKGLDFDLQALAGVNAGNGAGTVGFALTKGFSISKETSLILGPFWRVQGGSKPIGGIVLGITGTFGG